MAAGTRRAAPSIAAIAVSALIALSACSRGFEDKNFVGKWRSSKLATPIVLHANGEWEIRTDAGGVLQYGVWKVKGSQITWSYRIDAQVGHDWDPIVASTHREFRVKESDGSVTTFTKLE